MPVKSLTAYSKLGRYRKSCGDNSLPRDLGYDVCALHQPSRFVITHKHFDHIPVKPGEVLICAPPLYRFLMKLFEPVKHLVEIQEYNDYP